MTAARLTIRKIGEVARLHFSLAQSGRAIARACNVSPATVHDYLGRLRVAQLGRPLVTCLRLSSVHTSTESDRGRVRTAAPCRGTARAPARRRCRGRAAAVGARTGEASVRLIRRSRSM